MYNFLEYLEYEGEISQNVIRSVFSALQRSKAAVVGLVGYMFVGAVGGTVGVRGQGATYVSVTTQTVTAPGDGVVTTGHHHIVTGHVTC